VQDYQGGAPVDVYVSGYGFTRYGDLFCGIWDYVTNNWATYTWSTVLSSGAFYDLLLSGCGNGYSAAVCYDYGTQTWSNSENAPFECIY
jgi:hypothetical protein